MLKIENNKKLKMVYLPTVHCKNMFAQMRLIEFQYPAVMAEWFAIFKDRNPAQTQVQLLLVAISNHTIFSGDYIAMVCNVALPKWLQEK